MEDSQTATHPNVAPVQQQVDSLRQQLAGMAGSLATKQQGLSTGCKQLDRLLPGGGLRPGMLVEWLGAGRSSGAGTLAMHCTAEFMRQQAGTLVVTDRWQRFYPPGAVARGISPQRLMVVRSAAERTLSSSEELWALDQALRCPAVSVVLAWLDQVDARSFRRLQLAAETGRTLAMLVRPDTFQSQPTWSDVQLAVRAIPPAQALPAQTEQAAASDPRRFCQVTLLRQRAREGNNIPAGAQVQLAVDDAHGRIQHIPQTSSRPLHMAPSVAHPAARRRTARA